MTIFSIDNFGHASGSISMSELRDYYGQSGAVSLNANLNGGTNPVPSNLPASGATTSFSNYRGKSRVLKKKGNTQVQTTGTTFTPSESGTVEHHIWVIGAGGTGGGSNGDGGREKAGSGGGGAGCAKVIISSTATGMTSATVSIASRPAASLGLASDDGSTRAGVDGGSTTFSPNGNLSVTVTANGGGKGFGGRQGGVTYTDPTAAPYTTTADNSSTTTSGQWGGASAGLAGSASATIVDSVGKFSRVFYAGSPSEAINVGSDDAASSTGGSPNFGEGSQASDTIVSSGTTQILNASFVTQPSSWNGVNGISAGSAVASCAGGTGLQGNASDYSYGCGGGGASNQGGSGSVNQPGTHVQPGRGGSGAIIANHYEINT